MDHTKTYTTYELRDDIDMSAERFYVGTDADAIAAALRIAGRTGKTGNEWKQETDGTRTLPVYYREANPNRLVKFAEIVATVRTPGKGYWNADEAKREKQPTARFFVYWFGNIKLSLRPGETQSFERSGPTEEGASYYAESYEYDKELGAIVCNIADSGRDCDGGYDHSRTFYAWVDEIAENDERRPRWMKEREFWNEEDARSLAHHATQRRANLAYQTTIVIDDAGNGRAIGSDMHAIVREANEASGFKHASRLVVWNDSEGNPFLVVAAHSYLDCELSDDEARDMAREYVSEINGREEREPDEVI